MKFGRLLSHDAGGVGKIKKGCPHPSHGKPMVEFRDLVCHQLDADLQNILAVDGQIEKCFGRRWTNQNGRPPPIFLDADGQMFWMHAA